MHWRPLLAFCLVWIACAYATELICHEDDCYPKVFEATDEFALVKPDQQVPKGLHVRLDLNTEEKWAKLDDGKEASNAVIVSEVEEPVLQAGPVMHSASDAVHPPSYLTAVGDNDLYDACLDLLQASMDEQYAHAVDENDVVMALEGLGDLVHQIDFGQFFAEGRGLDLVRRVMDRFDSTHVRSSASLVLSSALQNNPRAQEIALNQRLHHTLNQHLKTALQRTTLDLAVMSRYISTLGHLYRGRPDAQHHIQDSLDLLLTVFDAVEGYPEAEKVHEKCALLIDDLANPDMQAPIKVSHDWVRRLSQKKGTVYANTISRLVHSV